MARGDIEAEGLLFLFSPNGNEKYPSNHDLAISYFTLLKARHSATYTAKDSQLKVAILYFTIGDVEENPMILTSLKKQLHSLSGNTRFRLYRLLNAKTCPDFDQKPSNIVQVVSLEPGDDLTRKEFNDWYEEEHTPLYSRIPGWRRTVRGELLDTNEDPNDFGRYLAIHEWESMDSYKTEQYFSAINTPWQKRIMGLVDQSKRERIVFKFDSELAVLHD